MANPVPKRSGRGDSPGKMVRVEFLMPRTWRDELRAMADRQAIDLADVLRIIVRGFMRERLPEHEQRRLGMHD